MPVSVSNSDQTNADVSHHLSGAIDPDVIQSMLLRHWQPAVEGQTTILHCAVHRVFPRGDAGFVVKYVLQLKDRAGEPYEQTAFGEITVQDCVVRRQSIQLKLQKRRRAQLAKKQDSSSLVAIPSLNMLLRFPGLDEKLPGLRLLHDPEWQSKLFAVMFPHCASSQGGSIEATILNHRIGKRCVLRLRAGDEHQHRSVIARCLKENDTKWQENVDAMKTLWHSGLNDRNPHRVRVPRVYGAKASMSTVFIEDVPGDILGESDRWPLEQQGAIAGKSIAVLHGIKLALEKRYTAQQEIKMLREWVTLTQKLRPDLHMKLSFWMQVVADDLKTKSYAQECLAHRDFYGKQILFDGHQTTLIDFDTLCLAPPALDLGNYLAHRILAKVTGEAFNQKELNAFLQGYAAIRPLPSEGQIRIWKNAALLRLACLYALRTGWEGISHALLRHLEQFDLRH